MLQYDDIFHFGNFPAQYQLSNDFSFKLTHKHNQNFKTSKMYLKIPFYQNFKNIAYCPSNIPETMCCIVDKKEEITLQFEGNCTYVPFKPRHFYIMYCGNDDSEPVTYFQNEQSMWSFLANVIGTHLGKFFVHDYIISRSFAPHLTPDVQIFEVEIFKSSSQLNHMS